MRLILVLLIFFGLPGSTFASGEGPQSFTIDGRLYADPAATTPLTDSDVRLVFQILDPTQSCILYEETHAHFNAQIGNGYFTLRVGSAVGTAKRSAYDSANPMSTIYSNSITNINGRTLVGGACSYSPALGDLRYLRIQITPSSDGMTRNLSPNMPIDAVPLAMVAERAENLQGLGPANLLQVNTSGSEVLSQSNLENIFSSSNYSALTALLAGSSGLYSKPAANGTTPLANVSSPASPAAGQMWYDSGAIKFYNGSTTQTLGVSGAGITSLVAGTGLNVGAGPGGTISSTGTLNVDTGTTAGQIVQVAAGNKLPVIDGSNLTLLNGSAINSGTIGGSTAVNTSGGVTTTGAVSAGSITTGGAVTATGNITGSTVTGTAVVGTTGSFGSTSTGQISLFDHPSTNTNYITLKTPATASLTSDYVLTLPDALPGSSGQVLTSDTSGKLTWTSPSSGSVTSVGGTAPITISGTGAAPVVNVSAATTTTSGVVTLAADGGTTASTVVQATDARLSDARLPSNNSDLLKVSAMPANCAAGSSLTFSSPSGSWVCTTIPDATASSKGIMQVGTGLAVSSGTVSLTSGIATPGTYSKVTVDTYGRVTTTANIGSSDVTTALGFTPLNKAGDVMTGTFGLNPISTATETTLVTGFGASDKGKMWFNTDLKKIHMWDGSAIVSVTSPAVPTSSQNGQSLRWNDTSKAWEYFTAGVSGSGIGTFNTLTGNTQTLANGSAGTAPGWVSSGSTHTLNIPMASTSSVTAGLISKTDYDNFNGKISDSYTLAGDVTGTPAATSVDRIKGKAVTTPTASGQMLVYDGTGITPVAMSSDATMAATGAVTLKNTGTAGTYYKVTTDAKGRVSSGVTTLTSADLTDAGDLLKASNMPATCSADKTLTFSSPTGTWVCSTIAIDAAAIASGTIADARLPASAKYWTAATGGINYAGGNVGIGTTAPGGKLHIRESASVDPRSLIIENNVDTANSALITLQKSRGTSSLPVVAQAEDTIGNLRAQVFNGSSYVDAGNIQFSAAADFTSSAPKSFMAFTTNDGVGIGERMRILSSGNIGIGTTTPTTALQVNGTVSATAFTGNGSGLTNVTASGVPWTGVTGRPSVGLVNMVPTSGNAMSSAWSLAWKNYGDHQIVDMSAGTAPNGTSHSNTNAETPWSATYPSLMGWNGSGTYGLRVDSARTADTLAGFTMNQNLNTTNNPTFGTIYTGNWFRSNGATGWYNETYGGGIYMTDSSWVRTYGSKNFYVQGGSMAVDGNVGIGTTAPAGALDVRGNTYVNYLNVRPESPTAGEGGQITLMGANGYNGINIDSYLSNLRFHSAYAGANFNFDMANGNLQIGGFLTQSSDRRLKRDIHALDNSLEKILSLQGVSYYWKRDKGNEKPQIGLIAQEVEKIYPETVLTDAEGWRSVAYQNLVAPLIQAFKEFHTKWSQDSAELHERANKAERELASVNAKLSEQQVQLELLKSYICNKDPAAPVCR